MGEDQRDVLVGYRIQIRLFLEDLYCEVVLCHSSSDDQRDQRVQKPQHQEHEMRSVKGARAWSMQSEDG